jgi:hypothetical protein
MRPIFELARQFSEEDRRKLLEAVEDVRSFIVDTSSDIGLTEQEALDRVIDKFDKHDWE